MKKFPYLLILLTLFAAACGTAGTATATVTDTPGPVETETLTPTNTLLPPQPTITPVPIIGTLTSKVNVRSGPDTSYDSYGILNSGETVQIVQQNAKKTWYQILYPSSPTGKGWVAAYYVKVDDGVRIPIDATATPVPSGPSGTVTIRVNVRSGPATTYPSLGMLEANTVVNLTGKNAAASWFQIEYASGHGWVAAQYVKTDATNLPVLDDYGTPAAASTPTGMGSTPNTPPTPTTGAVPDDGDSAANPLYRLTFSASSPNKYIITNQVSAPQGDAEDWVEFTPFSAHGATARLLISLTCTGNGSLAVELLQNNAPVTGWGSLQCGDSDREIAVAVGGAYVFHLTPAPGGNLRMIAYTLKLVNEP